MATSKRSRSRAGRGGLCVEQLEERRLLSGFQPTATEQLFLEELNDARANPAAYGAAIGVDLSNVAPAPPLAFNVDLIRVARMHSIDMNSRAYFSHVTPEGLYPGDRIRLAGFEWTAADESLAGGTAYPTPADALQGLITDRGIADLGHRRQLLAIDQIYRDENQVGVGIVQNGAGPLVNYYTIDTAATTSNEPSITGVVFTDVNGDGNYAPGEGVGNVTITIAGAGSTTTFDSGGYALAARPGAYTVTASGGSLAAPLVQTVTVGTTNVRLNFIDGKSAYIEKDYLTALGRAASQAEVASWLPVLNRPGGPALVASLIEHSPEARTRLVRNWYVTYLGRPAVNGEEQGWVNALVNGVPEETTLAQILSSPEFLARADGLHTSGTSGERFVQALYSLLLNRAASAAEVNGWAGALPVLGFSGVALAFEQSLEHRTNVVISAYARILRRAQAPTFAEITSWANSALNLTDLRTGFESSIEFLLNG